jgi:hypothetical protein
MGGIKKDRAVFLFQAPLVMEVPRQAEHNRIQLTVATQGMGTCFAHGKGKVMNTVGRLMSDNDIRLYRLEKTVHFVILLAYARSGAIRYAIPLGNSGSCSPGASITGDFQRLDSMAFEMEVPIPEDSVPQIHIVIAGKGKGTSPGEKGKHVFQEPVVLLEDLPSPVRLIAIAVPLFRHFPGKIGVFQKLVHEILQGHISLAFASSQIVEKILEVKVAPRHSHRVERDVEEVAGDNVNIGGSQVEEFANQLEGAVYIRHVYQLHDSD